MHGPATMRWWKCHKLKIKTCKLLNCQLAQAQSCNLSTFISIGHSKIWFDVFAINFAGFTTISIWQRGKIFYPFWIWCGINLQRRSLKNFWNIHGIEPVTWTNIPKNSKHQCNFVWATKAIKNAKKKIAKSFASWNVPIATNITVFMMCWHTAMPRKVLIKFSLFSLLFPWRNLLCWIKRTKILIKFKWNWNVFWFVFTKGFKI